MRADYNLNCSAKTFYDRKEQIIVENEQTVSWTLFGEQFSRLKDGSVGWVPTIDRKTTVNISVSLVTDELPTSAHQGTVYIVIAATVGIGVTAFALLLKKKGK